ncbi:MAG: hypothetical protein EOP08_02655 [Proteobacteria bacterium]|nr:MAG: hypothetical protein EOP08_02655 [Pseudomonadota bacterium]
MTDAPIEIVFVGLMLIALSMPFVSVLCANEEMEGSFEFETSVRFCLKPATDQLALLPQNSPLMPYSTSFASPTSLPPATVARA